MSHDNVVKCVKLSSTLFTISFHLHSNNEQHMSNLEVTSVLYFNCIVYLIRPLIPNSVYNFETRCLKRDEGRNFRTVILCLKC